MSGDEGDRDPPRARGMVPSVPMRVPTPRAGALRGEAYGVAFEVRLDDRRLLPAVRARLPPRWRLSRRSPAVVLSLAHETRRAGVAVRVEGHLAARGLSHRQALDVLESELQLSVARLARPEVFVHAGVVAVEGRAILVPGRSGAGKTTLVRALVDAGATYYSDEYAVLDREGRVHPYPRRPSVRVRSGTKERHPVPRRRGRAPVPAGLVVETRYRPDARWTPVSLSPGEIAFALLANTVPARERPADVLAVLARTAAQARGVRSERGPAARTARLLIALARQLAAGEREPRQVRRRGALIGSRPRSPRRSASSRRDPAHARRRRPPPSR
jgi:hypothetical protein